MLSEPTDTLSKRAHVWGIGRIKACPQHTCRLTSLRGGHSRMLLAIPGRRRLMVARHVDDSLAAKRSVGARP